MTSKSSLIIVWCLGYVALKNTCTTAQPSLHDIRRHERRKRQKQKHVRAQNTDVLVELSNSTRVHCAFTNPALEHAEKLLELGLFDSFKAAVEYVELTNAPFSAALEKWLLKNITLEGLYDEGFAMGEIHRDWFQNTTSTHNKTEVICGMESALYSQMKNTCFYSDWENDLITVSVALIEGFAHAVEHTFEGCVG